MSDLAIKVENISKKYYIGSHSKSGSLRETISDRLSTFLKKNNDGKEFWALKNISFEIKQGESLGLIGKNGTGKSTLLKILSKITIPTNGNISIYGKIASLLEVGTGFHPDLTGRENIFLNGALMGMKKKEIVGKFDQIVDFSGVEEFIDTPVKRYSSGMYVRLAFAVAAHLDPDILLIDEVLAVGDLEFQKKCLGKMEEVTQSGRTIIFVSHNMGAIEEFCRRAILLDHGTIAFDGNTRECIHKYTHAGIPSHLGLTGILPPRHPICYITDITIRDKGAKPKLVFDLREEMVICFDYILVKTPILDISVVLSRNGIDVFFTIDTDSITVVNRETGTYHVQITIPPMFLKEGNYLVHIDFRNPLDGSHYNSYKNIFKFEVQALSMNTTNKGYYSERNGLVIFPGQWAINKVN